LSVAFLLCLISFASTHPVSPEETFELIHHGQIQKHSSGLFHSFYTLFLRHLDIHWPLFPPPFWFKDSTFVGVISVLLVRDHKPIPTSFRLLTYLGDKFLQPPWTTHLALGQASQVAHSFPRLIQCSAISPIKPRVSSMATFSLSLTPPFRALRIPQAVLKKL
jgi:hypothetical protein